MRSIQLQPWGSCVLRKIVSSLSPWYEPPTRIARSCRWLFHPVLTVLPCRPIRAFYRPFPLRSLWHTAQPPCIFRKIQKGEAPPLHRADGGPSDGKKGKIPLLTPLTTYLPVIYKFNLWKIVDFCKNHYVSCKKTILILNLLST